MEEEHAVQFVYSLIKLAGHESILIDILSDICINIKPKSTCNMSCLLIRHIQFELYAKSGSYVSTQIAVQTTTEANLFFETPLS